MAVEGVWRDEFKCHVTRVDYDFEERVGYVSMPPMCCTDMQGTIAFFQKIDVDVSRIVTMCIDTQDKSFDTEYIKHSSGRWYAKGFGV